MDIEEPLPEWAEGFTNKYKTLNASLPTRDGRNTGNGVVIAFVEQRNTSIIKVVTDAGNILNLTDNEVEELFYKPKYVMKQLLSTHMEALKKEFYDVEKN